MSESPPSRPPRSRAHPIAGLWHALQAELDDLHYRSPSSTTLTSADSAICVVLAYCVTILLVTLRENCALPRSSRSPDPRGVRWDRRCPEIDSAAGLTDP